jgi:DNA modification methylase
MGSGSTILACKKSNRNYIGIEIEEEYYKISNNRLTSC